jgi:hypothetical protein
MSSFLLVCAVVASLAVGVFMAQGLCVLMFGIFRMHAQQVEATRVSQAQPVELRTARG